MLRPAVPLGLALFGFDPGVETPGDCQMSLRDKHSQRLRARFEDRLAL